MESPKTEMITKDNDGLRLRILIGKFRVLERHGAYIKIALGGSTTMTIHDLPYLADIRPGDLLTFYTEAPIAKPS